MRITERAARAMISIGGGLTVLAVGLILVFLVAVVVPLFAGAHLTDEARAPIASTSKPLQSGFDEYQLMCWVLYDDGALCTYRVDDGEMLERRDVLGVSANGRAGAPKMTACAPTGQAGEIALGFSDGSLRLGKIGFQPHFLAPENEPGLVQELARHAIVRVGPALVQRTSEGQLRAQQVAVTLDAPFNSGSKAAITRLDVSATAAKSEIAVLDARGTLALLEIRRRENMMTGEVTSESSRAEVPFAVHAERGAPEHVLLSGACDSLYLAWSDGHLQRYDVRDSEHVNLAEEKELVDGGAQLTAFAFLIGKTTLVAGDSEGRVRCWFTTKPALAPTRDGATLAMAHELVHSGAGIMSLATSARSRVLAIGDTDGGVRLFHVTSEKELARVHVAENEAVTALCVAPKDDGLLAFTTARLAHWKMDLGHPEASLGALFAPVWYEGYEKPEHVWQSTSGTDDFEPKLGLVPLVFGTLKATFYSMLFGVPIALLAAIFTSEFSSPRLRAPLKAMTEMMASLPSVVLGFLAALVIAPFLQDVVPAVLTAFVTVPGALLCGAYAWQLLPQRIGVRLQGTPRFVAIAAMLPLGVIAAARLGPEVERLLFAGDLRAWLDKQVGDAIGGWMLLLLPLCAMTALAIVTRIVHPRLRRVSADWSRALAARVDLAQFIGAIAFTFALAYGAAWVMNGLALDPRGSVLDTYVQRNALVVGFVMGFAIIPIVYTLAEDALSSVPSHLRLASLGAGATPWQTAMRVVVPTAMSGIFSAVMIGLGRAVGETMIVLMATGNTPVMSWNVFNGFRTLSANIAVELPEAVQNSTHYRTLFLAALCLFGLTLVLNTFAELVRQRFRKRAFQL